MNIFKYFQRSCNFILSRFAMISIVILAAAPVPSFGYVQCTVMPTQIYVDDGLLWVNFDNGGAGVSLISDPATRYYYTSALAAFTTGKHLIVRYADGTACTAFNTTMIGMWISS